MLLFFLSLPSVSIRAEPEKINGSEEGGVDDEDVSDIIEQPIEDTDFLWSWHAVVDLVVILDDGNAGYVVAPELRSTSEYKIGYFDWCLWLSWSLHQQRQPWRQRQEDCDEELDGREIEDW